MYEKKDPIKEHLIDEQREASYKFCHGSSQLVDLQTASVLYFM